MALRPTLPIIFALLSAGLASASNGFDGRYGHTEIRYLAGKPTVYHKNQKVLTVDEADAAAILRVVSGTTQDLLVIQSWKPGPACHNSYRLLRIQAGAPVEVSPELGDCSDFAGVSFAGPYAIAHLRQTEKIEQLMWKDSRLFALPPITPACFTKHQQAIEGGSNIQPQQTGFMVAGEGRLQFHSAPEEHCEIAGTFVIAGDRLEASHVQGRYTWVVYQNPKTGNVAAGWVETSCLKQIN